MKAQEVQASTPGRLLIGVFASTYPPAVLGGGPARTLEALVESAPKSTTPMVLAPDHDQASTLRLDVEANRWTAGETSDVYYCSDRSVLDYWNGLRALRARRPDVIYVNSFFSPKYAIVPQVLRLVRFWRAAPLLVAPRGEFSPGALAIRRPKKRLAIRLFRIFGMSRNVIWHASSGLEASDIRAQMGTSARVLVRENETSLSQRAAATAGADHGSGLHLVMVSRVTPKKGLDVLLDALESVTARVYLDIYGNHEDEAYLERCLQIAKRLPRNIHFRLHGHLDPAGVAEAFASADAFVFPTAGENFGHVIAESLSQSCPVITTDTTPWSARVLAGGGAIVANRNAKTWSSAIQTFAHLPKHELMDRRRAAGRAYNEWRSESKGPHIFELLSAELKGRVSRRR